MEFVNWVSPQELNWVPPQAVGAQPETFELMEDGGEKEEEESLRESKFIEEYESEGGFRARILQQQQSRPVVPDREEAAKLEDEPASPIREEWPKDSLLKPDHFTIDQQRCLHCSKELGYAMPMNRTPKVKYLFCDSFECQRTQHIHCWACGHFTSEADGHLVSRPGNSAYTGPSSIFSYMCKSCYRDQLEMEPGLEETRELFSKYREQRKEAEEKEKGIAELALQDPHYNPYSFAAQRAETFVAPKNWCGATSSSSSSNPRKRKKCDTDEGEKEE